MPQSVWQAFVQQLQSCDLAVWAPLMEVAAVLVAVVVAYRQLRLLRKQLETQDRKARRDEALKYSLARARELRPVREYVDRAFPPGEWQNKTVPIEVIDEAAARDARLQTEMISLLAHWENLALTVHSDVCDEDMAFEMVASTLVEYVNRFGAFIEQRRQTQSRRLYVYLLSLAKRWRQRLDKVGDKMQFRI